MRITKITVRGEKGCLAEIARSKDRASVEVEVFEHKRGQIIAAPASERDRLRELAETMQWRLDGCRGTAGEIEGYLDLIERVAGC